MPTRIARRVGVAAGAVGVAHDILLGEFLGRRLVPVRLLILRQFLRILVGEFLLPVGRALLRRAGGDRRALARIMFLRQKTPPFRAGDAWRSGSPCGRLSAVPQGLRELRLV